MDPLGYFIMEDGVRLDIEAMWLEREHIVLRAKGHYEYRPAGVLGRIHIYAPDDSLVLSLFLFHHETEMIDGNLIVTVEIIPNWSEQMSELDWER